MQSMTGYGKETSRQGDWEMTVELRAVNHRFLDLSMRLGRGLTFLEETIRKTLAPLCRGHVDVQLTLRRISGSDSDVTRWMRRLPRRTCRRQIRCKRRRARRMT